MKNIHVLPTDKDSKLYLGNLGKPVTIQSASAQFKEPLHIYITNDEEIKEGDWYYDDFIKQIIIADNKPIGNDCKKIILTTDLDLIKDGVQAIDDEFLEWFVKNPSCEEVDVENPLIANVSDFGYKIIIPKEETKTTGDISVDYSIAQAKVIQKCMQLDAEVDYKSLPKQETIVNGKCFKCGNSQYNIKRPFCTDEFCNEDFYQKPKQETLLQIANRKLMSNDWLNGAEFGAKWQKEQNKNKYSEEEVEVLINALNKISQFSDIGNDFLAIIKMKSIATDVVKQFKNK